MARKRMIDPSFWTDEKLGECSRDERLLFMGLVSNADDEGYGRANPKLLRSSIFPYDDLRVSDCEKWLSRLGGLGLIALYEVDGQTYYHLPNFLKHQTINRPTPSSIPKPTEEAATRFSDRSMSTHGALTPNRREEKLSRREIEEKEITAIIHQECTRPKTEHKTAYAEFVTMTDSEYQSLCDRIGDAGAKRCIEILDNYKGASGKTYKSDYRAILNWVIARYEAEPKPEPEEPTVYEYPRPEDDCLTEIPEGATLADILPPAEEGTA